MSINLRWDITTNCRMNCIHCYNSRFRKSRNDVLSQQDINIIIDKFPAYKINVVKLMGGESFDSKNIVYICAGLSRRGISFGVTTNGDFDWEFANEVAFSKSGFLYITFSMDGYEDEAKLFRKKLDVDNVISNIKKVKKYYPKVIICLNLILNTSNYDKIRKILNFYVDLGVEKINISQLSGREEIIRQYQCDNLQLIAAIEDISRFVDEHEEIVIECGFACNKIREQIKTNINNKISFDYRCLAGREIGYIDYMGNLLPCEAILKQEQLYNFYISSGEYSLLINDFDTIWMQKAFNDVYKHDVLFRYKNRANNPNCKQCLSKNVCGDCFYEPRTNEEISYAEI